MFFKSQKLFGFFLGILVFFLVLILPPTDSMWFYGAKTVLKHSKKEVFKSLKINSYNDLKVKDLKKLLEATESVKIKIPKDFSKEGFRGIAYAKGEGIKLKKAIDIQAKAIKNTIAAGLLMAMWWITEAVPIPITSLLPLLLFPLLNIAPPKRVAFPGFFNPFYPYMHYLIVLFLSGFTIAEAMKRWNLHKRISLFFLSKADFSPKKIIFAFMLITAFTSMFISNTATAAMMLPIGLGIVGTLKSEKEKNNFGKALMLSIAYSASIGGVGTLIGTPPNVVLAGFLDNLLNIKVTFQNWLLVGLLVVFFMLPAALFILTRIFPIGAVEISASKKLIEKELHDMGKLSKGEKTHFYICFNCFFVDI